MPISYTTRRRPPPVRNAECRLQISDCGLRIMASMSGFGHWGLVIGTSGFPLSAVGGFASLFASRRVLADEAAEMVRLVDDDIIAFCGKAELSMLFRGESASECRDWQRAFRAKLTELLGNFNPPKTWNAVEENHQQFDDHIRYELVLQADGVPSVPVYLLVPAGVAERGKLPAVLCVHGHGRFGHHPVVGRTDLEGVSVAIEKANYDYGLQFVRRGYVVAANLRDLRWSIDLLQSRSEVDGDRIGCAGLSYGGRMTMLVSAIAGTARLRIRCSIRR